MRRSDAGRDGSADTVGLAASPWTTGPRTRILAVRMACADIHCSRAFYIAALGCRETNRREPVARARGGPCEHVHALRLGAQRLELVPASRPGGALAGSTSTAFQHVAIIVDDMRAAMRRLARVPGWRAISRDGPESLTASSGGVTAFKFRDPDGHPLELLQFPDGGVPAIWRDAPRHATGSACLGIDHTAIGVADTERSIAWYVRLGYAVATRGVNTGIEQERMDDVDGVRVKVTGLRQPGGAPPHLELLCYRDPGPVHERVPAGDRRATRTVLSSGPSSGVGRRPELRDPDGHRLALADRSHVRRTGLGALLRSSSPPSGTRSTDASRHP